MQDFFFKIVNLLKYKLLARHRKGFSIHSPFVFELLNNVFFEKEHYYCYEKIEKIVAENTRNTLFYSQLKYYELFFRLANRFNAQNFLIVGKNSFIEKIFSFVSSETQFFYSENIEKMQNFDLIFFAENSFGNFEQNDKFREQNRFFSAVKMAKKNNSVLIFENIYKNKKINRIWTAICNDNNLKISMDIFYFGIIILKNSIPKQHYRIAF